jgi:hypothetical protein
MARLWSFGPDHIRAVNLDVPAVWMLGISAPPPQQATTPPHLIVQVSYPPAESGLMFASYLTLANLGMPVASAQADLYPVAHAMISQGSEEADIVRTTEAFQLFKNSPRAKQDILEACTNDGIRLVKVYWRLRRWLQAGAVETIEETVDQWTIKGTP